MNFLILIIISILLPTALGLWLVKNDPIGKKEAKKPCKRHYYQASNFTKCSNCGWSEKFKKNK